MLSHVRRLVLDEDKDIVEGEVLETRAAGQVVGVGLHLAILRPLHKYNYLLKEVNNYVQLLLIMQTLVHLDTL